MADYTEVKQLGGITIPEGADVPTYLVPLVVPNLYAHWVADDIRQANNTDVATWLDRVSGLPFVPRPGATTTPKYATGGINGLPAVYFDGTTGMVSALPAALDGDTTIAVTFKGSPSSSAESRIFSSFPSQGFRSIRRVAGASLATFWSYSSGSTESHNLPISAANAGEFNGTPKVVAIRHNFAAGTVQGRLYGGTLQTSPDSISGRSIYMAKLLLGASGDSGALSAGAQLTGWVSEVRVYRRAITDEELTDVLRTMAATVAVA